MSEHLSSQDEHFQKWVYALSHDMGAPLRAVVQFSMLLSRKLDARLDDKERYWLHLIHENGALGQAMIEGLLRYSRLSTYPQELNEDVSLKASIESAIGKLSNAHADKQFDIDVSGLSHSIEGNAELWQQYFFQILDNSLKFQPPESNPIIRASSVKEHDFLEVLVEDNGFGVNTEKFNDIALPFKRLVSSNEFPGVGMGLSYCQRILELHRGTLSFDTSSLGGLTVVGRLAI